MNQPMKHTILSSSPHILAKQLLFLACLLGAVPADSSLLKNGKKIKFFTFTVSSYVTGERQEASLLFAKMKEEGIKPGKVGMLFILI